LPVISTLLVKLGAPVDNTLCGVVSVFTQVQVTVPPTATVSTAGFTVLFRLLLNRIFPTRTLALVGMGGTGAAVAVNISAEDPVRTSAVAVIVTGPTVAGRVKVTADVPDPSVGTVVPDRVPPVVVHPTSTPGTPLPN
jgi:hypothetical protein